MPALPIAIYGDSGVGKTAVVSQCFRRAYWFMYDNDGLATAQSLWGYKPRHYQMRNLEDPVAEAVQAIHQLRPAVQAKKISSVVIDTGTELANRVFYVLNEKHGGQPMNVYPAIRREFSRIMREVLNMDIPIVVIFQEAPPRERSKTMDEKLGGPDVPGSTVRELRPMFSLILRVAIVSGEGGLQRRLLCDPFNKTWIMKDRYNVCTEDQPLDLRPIMKKILAA